LIGIITTTKQIYKQTTKAFLDMLITVRFAHQKIDTTYVSLFAN